MRQFDIITLFPQAFPGTLDLSILKKSRGSAWDMHIHDMREFGIGKHKQVDDEVFAGGAGMLIKPDVIDNAMQAIQPHDGKKQKRIFLSPRGKTLNQSMVEEFAGNNEDILILCGRYEGVDARAIEYFEFEEISIGNYILAGAEVAALTLMEAIIRKIPGVIGNQESFTHETFTNNEISEPRYTRPAEWITHKGDTISIDPILLSGNHKKIEDFQKSRRKGINKEDK